MVKDNNKQIYNNNVEEYIRAVQGGNIDTIRRTATTLVIGISKCVDNMSKDACPTCHTINPCTCPLPNLPEDPTNGVPEAKDWDGYPFQG